jgi:hypothetical protein
VLEAAGAKGYNTGMRTKNIFYIALGTAVLLLLPFIAMQFSDQVKWTLSDFIIAGVLLFGTGLAYEFISKMASSLIYRLAVGWALLTALLLIWINLAVGIIGSDDNPANGMYLGVLAVAAVGALVARFKPRGMTVSLLAVALTQAVITVIAFVMSNQLDALKALLLNGFFIALWLGAAWLFRRSQTSQTQPG